MAVKKDSFNRTGQESGYVRLPISNVEGAASLKPGDNVVLTDVEEGNIFPECTQPVAFNPNMEGSENLVKDPSIYGEDQGYGSVVFDPN